MKRLLLIIPTLVRGGAEKQFVMLATGLPRDEFDVHVCVLTHSGPLESELQRHHLPYRVIGKRWKIDPLCYWRLRNHVKHLRPDIVHTWLFAANCYGRQAAVGAGVPHIIGGERSVDPWKADYELWIDRRLAARSDRIATNSPGVVDFYTSRGIPREKFVVIPNGVVMPAAAPMPREELLAELGLPAGTHLIGAVGRLWPQKRQKDLIWAAELLKAVRDDVHLLLIGDGPQRAQLERFVRQVDIGDRVHFMGARDDVASLMPHFACLWLASGYEGQSNAVMEAMAHGLPVVASDIPGTRDLVIDGETGYLVPVGDTAEFARKTNRLLDHGDLAARLGAAGKDRVASHFTVEQMIAGHVQLYREVLGVG